MKILGFVMILIGVILGLYVGLWVCFIGGIVQIIDAVKIVETPMAQVGWGVTKMIFAAFSGWLCALVFVVPGIAMVQSEPSLSDKLRNYGSRVSRSKKDI